MPAFAGDLFECLFPEHRGRLMLAVTIHRRAREAQNDHVRPEIVSLPNSLLISLAPAIKSAIDVPICCTLQGEDVFLEGLGEPYRREALGLIRAHGASVDRFVAVKMAIAKEIESFAAGFKPPVRPKKRTGDTSSALESRVMLLSFMSGPEDIPIIADIYERVLTSPDFMVECITAEDLQDPEALEQVRMRVESMNPRLGLSLLVANPAGELSPESIPEGISAVAAGFAFRSDRRAQFVARQEIQVGHENIRIGLLAEALADQVIDMLADGPVFIIQ